MRKPPHWLTLLISLIVLAGLTLLAPAERTLGAAARLVYLHGAIVWAALLVFALAGLAGLAGLLPNRRNLIDWSTALARAALLLWLVQLPLSLLVMQLNWGGLFLDEPRWRVSLTFAGIAILVQAALAIAAHPRLTALANAIFAVALGIAIRNVSSMMHPDSPLMNPDARSIQIFFGLLLITSLWLAALGAAWLHARMPPKPAPVA